MSGPSTQPTRSVLAYDDHGVPCSFWECGLPTGKVTELPPFTVEIPLQGGGAARASFPSAIKRVHVDDPQRERVTEYFDVAKKPARLGVGKRKPVCGVHVFAEERSDGFVGVEVIVNTGTLDPGVPGSWPGAVRFKDILIALPAGWTRTGGSFGPPGDWYSGPRCLIARRMAFVPVSAGSVAYGNALKWLARADLKVSGHSSLGPARHKLPELKSFRHQPMHGGVSAGPLMTDQTSFIGGEVSGYLIAPLGGWEGSTGAARTYGDDVHRTLAGHPCAAFHMKSGEPILPHEWAHVEGYPMTDGYLRYNPQSGQHPDPGSLVGTFGWALQAGGPREFNPGPSTSASTVNAIQKKDGAHLIRAIQVLTAAWWQTRSWSARLVLRMIAADVATSQILKGSNQYLREQGWTRKAIATAIALLPPGNERNFYMNERDQALRHLSDTILINGWARSGFFPNSDNGEPWAMGLPAWDTSAAAWQLALYMDGLFDMLRCGPLTSITKPRADWLLTEALSNLIDGPLMQKGSPPTHVAVTDSGIPAMPVKLGTADRAYDHHFVHDWHSLTLAWLWTGDVRFKALVEKVGNPQRDLWKLKAFWGTSVDQQPEFSAVPRAYL